MPGTQTPTAPDPAQSILAAAPIAQQDKADLWEQFHGAKDENDLAARLQSSAVPASVKADLWEAKHTAAPLSNQDQYTADQAAGQESPAVAARHARSSQGKDIQRGTGTEPELGPLGPSQMLYDASDYLRRKRDAAEVQSLSNVAKGGKPSNLKASAYDAVSRAARIASGITEPTLKNAAITAGIVTGGLPALAAGTYMAGEGAIQGYKNRQGLKDLNAVAQDKTGQTNANPEEVENSILPWAEAAGGGALLAGGLKARAAAQQAKAPAQSLAEHKTAIPATAKELNLYPPADNPTADSAYTRARPYLENEHVANPVKGKTAVREAFDNANNAVGTIEDHVKKYIDAMPPGTKINSNAVIQAASDALDRGTWTPEDKARGMKALEGYGLEQDMPLSKVDSLRKKFNGLNTSYLGTNTAGRAVAYTTNPEFVARDAALDELRSQEYDTLANNNVPGVGELRKDEGALIQMRNAYERNVVKSERENPSTPGLSGVGRIGTRRAAQLIGGTLGSTVGKFGAAAGIEAGNLAAQGIEGIQRGRNTQNALLERSFSRKVGQPRVMPAVPTQVPTNANALALRPGAVNTPPKPMPLITPPTTTKSVFQEYTPETQVTRSASGRMTKLTGTEPAPAVVGQTAEGGPIKEQAPAPKAVQKAAGPYPARLTPQLVKRHLQTLRDPMAPAMEKIEAMHALAQDNGMLAAPNAGGQVEPVGKGPFVPGKEKGVLKFLNNYRSIEDIPKEGK